MGSADESTRSTPSGAGPEVSAENERKLIRWENRTAPAIVIAAVLPLARLGADPGALDATFWVDLGCWGLFAADLVVHMRLVKRYWTTLNGIIDIAIVAFTFPWYVIPVFDRATLIGIIRLARVVRIFWIALGRRGVVRMVRRLGKAALYTAAILFICSAIVLQNEPSSAGFDNYGDALWWGIVTITTVGYGDLVPQTTEGRIAASILMLSGIALLGVLAGTLANFMNLEPIATVTSTKPNATHAPRSEVTGADATGSGTPAPLSPTTGSPAAGTEADGPSTARPPPGEPSTPGESPSSVSADRHDDGRNRPRQERTIAKELEALHQKLDELHQKFDRLSEE